ncbi:MAG: hypothetical protein K8S14_07610, partial [Actinomycetia bacterium]|nr:hypothetical protein [Actinomycetes bacterium]
MGDDLSNIETIKTAIMTYGAIGTGFCSHSAFLQSTVHYQPPGNPSLPNHAVTIVGWDDNKPTQAPEGLGAWLVKNSWGSGWGESGYFWISYYDKYSCRESYMGAVSFQDVVRSEYAKIYYHDYHGWRATKEDVSEAFNSFTPDEPGSLVATSFFSSADDAAYVVKVYGEFDGGQLLGELASQSGVVDHRGFHTVDLDAPLVLLPGQKFHIYVSLSKGGHGYDKTADVPVLLGASYRVIVESSANPGESFYRQGAVWHDLYELNNTANFCIKGLTVAPDESDCDGNGKLDADEIAADPSLDCNENVVLDICEFGGTSDCDGDGTTDLCEIYDGTSFDCQPNGIPDDCEDDCNENGIADECDIDTGFSDDCDGNGVPDECSGDCNDNGVWDECDIFTGTSEDCDGDGIPDDCEDTTLDCNNNGRWDPCDIVDETSFDFNENGIPDECDMADGSSTDCDENGIPDECDVARGPLDVNQQPDGSEVSYAQNYDDVYPAATIKSWDDFTLANPTSLSSGEAFFTPVDWSGFGQVDFLVEIADAPGGAEIGANVVFSALVTGESGTGIVRWRCDDLVLPSGTWWLSVQATGGYPEHSIVFWSRSNVGSPNGSEHYFHNPGGYWTGDSAPTPGSELFGVPADLAFRLEGGRDVDCNENGIHDACDILDLTSGDCNGDGIPDECSGDCDDDGIWNVCAIFTGASEDCNLNEIPDSCDIDDGTSEDCNENDIPDECDVALGGSSEDCNENGMPDECEPQEDCNANGVQDICDLAAQTSQDCNFNAVPDECDLADQVSEDCNGNSVPDECDISSQYSQDCNVNGVPDECDLYSETSTDWNANDIPDECEDCDDDGVPDTCELPGGCDVGDCAGAATCGESEDCD